MILVAGSANLDFVVRAPHIPAPGETVLGQDFQTFPGGKGANQAIACARGGGTPTAMLLALGHDSFAAPLEASLLAAGVRLHVLRSKAQPTGTAFICVSDAAENAITVAPGANLLLGPDDLPALDGISHLLMQLETPLASVAAYATAARAHGVQVVLNAAPAQSLAPELLALVDVLIVNEGELATLAGSGGSILQRMRSLPAACTVVTLGERGCCAIGSGHALFQPGFAVVAVDTTAAGDTFCGVLAAALAGQQSLAQGMRRAAAAGALACTRLGAQSSIPRATEIDTLLMSQPPLPADNRVMELQRYCEQGA